jgi:hypothetical protein
VRGGGGSGVGERATNLLWGLTTKAMKGEILPNRHAISIITTTVGPMYLTPRESVVDIALHDIVVVTRPKGIRRCGV